MRRIIYVVDNHAMEPGSHPVELMLRFANRVDWRPVSANHKHDPIDHGRDEDRIRRHENRRAVDDDVLVSPGESSQRFFHRQRAHHLGEKARIRSCRQGV